MEDSQLAGHKTDQPSEQENLEKQVRSLMSDDYFEQLQSTFIIERYGKEVAVLIIEMMLKNNSSPDKINDGTYMLQVIGKNAVGPILKAIDSSKIEKNYDVYLLNGLLETLGKIEDKSAAATVAAQLDKLDKVINEGKNQFLVELCQDSKIKVLSVLGELQDRSRVDDLLSLLGDGTKNVGLEIIKTLGKIGDKRALRPLLRLYSKSDDASYFVAQCVKDTFREIVKRDKIEIDDALFSKLTLQEVETLNQIYPKQRTQNGNHENGSNGKSANGSAKSKDQEKTAKTA